MTYKHTATRSFRGTLIPGVRYAIRFWWPRWRVDWFDCWRPVWHDGRGFYITAGWVCFVVYRGY